MKNKTTKKNLIDFELKVKKYYENKEIKAPIHLSGNNEDQLIKIFKKIKREDWVFSSWRNHYHALLHGINPEWLFNEIIEGRSMGIINKKKKILFFLNSWGYSTYSSWCRIIS